MAVLAEPRRNTRRDTWHAALTCAMTALLSLVLASGPSWSAGTLQPAGGTGTVRALVIGINRYAHPEVVPTLGGAVADALDLAQTFARLGVSDLNLLLDEQATKANLDRALAALVDRTVAGDLVFFTFAGHGWQDTELVASTEADGKDENFILHGFDGDQGWNERLVDDEAFNWFTKLEQKGAHVIFLADSCHGGGMVKGADPRAAGLHVRSIRRVKNPNAAAPGAFYRSTAIGQAPVKPQSAPASADAKWAADGTALKTMPHLTFVAAVDALTTVPEVLISGEATTRGAASYAFARALTGAADAAGNKDGLTTRQELASFVRHYVRTLSLERQSPMIQPLTAATHATGLFQITASPAPDVASSVAPLPPASAPQSLAPSSHPTPAVPAGITKPNPSQTAATASALMATQLLHDTRTGDVITPSGDVLAFNITAADLTPVVERVSAFGRLAQLSASRPQDLIMSPATPVFAGGERFVVTIPDILGHYIIIANLTGTGELQYMFPLGNADPLIDSPSLELPFTAGKPYGADTLIIIASRERATMLELELSQLGGKKKPLAVTDAIERLLPPASRLGIVTYQTRPPS